MLAFIFPGQGTQHEGMMKDLYSSTPCVKDVFDTADEVLGRKISSLCFEGSQSDLDSTVNTQPCMLTVYTALDRLFKCKGVQPGFTAGFSLGEYAALVSSGVIKFEDALRIIEIRSEAMQKAVPLGKGAMLAVLGADEATVEGLLDDIPGYLQISNYNCPGQFALAGEDEAAEAFIEKASSLKLRTKKLAISAPSHCKLMQPAADILEGVLKDIDFKPPQIPLYMNIDAMPCSDVNQIRKNLVLQIAYPVRWQQTLTNMHADGATVFLEAGPGRTLSGFVKKTCPEDTILQASDESSVNAALEVLSK